MKKLILLFLVIQFNQLYSQQSSSLSTLLPISKVDFGLYGIGSLNSEAFNNVNSSGKLSGFVSLYKKQDKNSLSLLMAVNRNANNNDSTIASTLLFPEVGKASFIGTLNWLWTINKGEDKNQFLGAFFQGSFKDIKGKRLIDSLNRDTSATFTILDWQLGLRYIKSVYHSDDDHVFFSASTFINFYNIPDEDNSDYRYIFNESKMPSSFFSVGAKLTLEVNRMQLFGDFRQTLGPESFLPNRELRGFNFNVGVIFNADFVEKGKKL